MKIIEGYLIKIKPTIVVRLRHCPTESNLTITKLKENFLAPFSLPGPDLPGLEYAVMYLSTHTILILQLIGNLLNDRISSVVHSALVRHDHVYLSVHLLLFVLHSFV